MNTAAPIDITESFKFFGLEFGVKQKTVKEAYKRYVKEFHPDLFPVDSSEQKMAAEKLIKANEHFKYLNLFFDYVKTQEELMAREKTAEPRAKEPETNAKAKDPEVEFKAPEGNTKPKEEPKSQDDWMDWEQQRHETWDSELTDWIARIEKIERDKKRGRTKRDKTWVVYFVRAFVAISLLVLWNGYFSENKAVDSKVGARQARLARAEATGNAVEVQWVKHTIDVEDHGFTGIDGGANWDKRAEEQPFKIVSMLFWTVVGVAILFSRQSIDLANKLLEKPGTRLMMASKEGV